MEFCSADVKEKNAVTRELIVIVGEGAEQVHPTFAQKMRTLNPIE